MIVIRDFRWSDDRDRQHRHPGARRPATAGLPDREIWIHCRSGYRASIAASILQAAGHAVVAIDDEYDQAEKAGLATVAGEAA